MDMKDTKALFLVILGSLLPVTGFAFTGAHDQLKSSPFGDGRSASVSPAGKSADGVSLIVAIPAPAPTPAKPTPVENIKKFLGEHKNDIFIGGIGAYIGWALIGGLAGALTGGLLLLVFFALSNL